MVISPTMLLVAFQPLLDGALMAEIWYHGGVNNVHHDIDGLVQERRNSSALALELRLSCINPLIWYYNEE